MMKTHEKKKWENVVFLTWRISAQPLKLLSYLGNSFILIDHVYKAENYGQNIFNLGKDNIVLKWYCFMWTKFKIM